MLTGMMNATSGEAKIGPYSMRTEMAKIRSTIGVCPQHDVLFKNLTVYEHLWMFAKFKNMPDSEMRKNIDEILDAVGLMEKKYYNADKMSGGQKRKLSLAIAFIGNPSVVFLDEPTSGMDPYSRRFTWDVIRKMKEGRVIVLTTHFMDEADLLGDRIAIMSQGELRCCGSSLFLKKEFGVGYNIVMERHTNHGQLGSDKPIDDFVRSYVSDAKLLSSVGMEISYQLPLESSAAFPSMFVSLDSRLEELGVIEYGVSVTTLEEVFLSIAHEAKNIDEKNASEKDSNKKKERVVYSKLDSSLALAYFFRHMRAMLNKRSIITGRDKANWFISFVVPVILICLGMLGTKFQVASTGYPSIAISAAMNPSSKTPVYFGETTQSHCRLLDYGSNPLMIPVPGQWCELNDYPLCYFDGSQAGFVNLPTDRGKPQFRYADADASQDGDGPVLGRKVEVWLPTGNKGKKEKKYDWFPGEIIEPSPTQFKVQFDDAERSAREYKMATDAVYRSPEFAYFNQWVGCNLGDCTMSRPQCSVERVADLIALNTNPHLEFHGVQLHDGSVGEASGGEITEIATLLHNTRDEHKGSRFGALLWTSTPFAPNFNPLYNPLLPPHDFNNPVKFVEFVAMANFTAANAAPAYISLANEMILRTYDPAASIKIRNHPFPQTKTQHDQVSASALGATVFMIQFSLPFVPASFAAFAIKDRISKAKHIQLVSGVTPPTYWLSTFIWDFTCFQISAWGVVILIYAFEIKGLIDNGAIGAVIALLQAWGASIACFGYCTSFLFDSPMHNLGFMVMFNFLIGYLVPLATCEFDPTRTPPSTRTSKAKC